MNIEPFTQRKPSSAQQSASAVQLVRTALQTGAQIPSVPQRPLQQLAALRTTLARGRTGEPSDAGEPFHASILSRFAAGHARPMAPVRSGSTGAFQLSRRTEQTPLTQRSPASHSTEVAHPASSPPTGQGFTNAPPVPVPVPVDCGPLHTWVLELQVRPRPVQQATVAHESPLWPHCAAPVVLAAPFVPPVPTPPVPRGWSHRCCCRTPPLAQRLRAKRRAVPMRSNFSCAHSGSLEADFHGHSLRLSASIQECGQQCDQETAAENGVFVSCRHPPLQELCATVPFNLSISI